MQLKMLFLLGYNLQNYYLVCVCMRVCLGGRGGRGTYFWWEGGNKKLVRNPFPGVFKKQHAEFSRVNKNNVEFPREAKEDSCEVSRGLGF